MGDVGVGVAVGIGSCVSTWRRHEGMGRLYVCASRGTGGSVAYRAVVSQCAATAVGPEDSAPGWEGEGVADL